MKKEMNGSVDPFEDIFAQVERESKGLPKSEPLEAPTFQPDNSIVSPHAVDQVDISNVEVPDNFVTTLVEHKEVVAEMPRPIVEEVSTPQTEDITPLIQEVKELLIEVKKVLTEMTTVGGIGVRMTSPGDRIVRTDNKKDKEEDEEKDPMKALLKKIRKRKTKTA